MGKILRVIEEIEMAEGLIKTSSFDGKIDLQLARELARILTDAKTNVLNNPT